MRKIMRKMLFGGLLFGLFFWIAKVNTWFQKTPPTDGYVRLAEEAKNRVTYLMSKSAWIQFSIPSFATKLKFIATANINPDIRNLEDMAEIRYSIEYEFLDKNTKVLASYTAHFKTSYIRFQDKNGQFVEKLFYVETPLHPNSAQSLILKLKNYPNASIIRLKIASHDPALADVGIRSYYLEPTSPTRMATLWQRMSKEKKAHLARANVYDISYLSAQEKNTLISALWKPNGPIGVENQDYKIRRLFVHPDADNIHAFVPFIPKIYADENLSASRSIPEGNYTLMLRSLSPKINHISVKEYKDKFTAKNQNYTLQAEEEKNIALNFKKKTLIDIKASQPLSIMLRKLPSQEVLDLPTLIASGYYRIEDNQSIRYHFHHPHPRFIRIECRENQAYQSTLTLKMTHRDGNITSKDYTLSLEASNYNYIKPFLPQSKAFYLYLTVDKEIETLEISANNSPLIRLSSRSPNMFYPLYSFGKAQQPKFQRLSAWFSLRPENFNSTALLAQKVSVYKQPQPPKINPFIALGQYNYTQLLAKERWYAHNLLLKRPLGNHYIRPQSWANIYSKLNSNTSYMLDFKADVGIKEIQADLLYFKETNTSDKNLSLHLDETNISLSPKQIFSSHIPLPKLSIDKIHRLALFTPKPQRSFFINHVAQNTDMYFKRKFLSFNKKMHFSFTKTRSTESLGFQIAKEQNPHYSSDTNKTASILSFRLHISYTPNMDTATYLSYTFQNYILHLDTSQEIALQMSQEGKALALSSPIYLPLGENLPNGEYNITIYPLNIPKKSYLFINHIILDEKPKIRITKEIL